MFNHELPDHIDIGHSLRLPDKMAMTECGMVGKVCRINFNPDYELSEIVDRFTELHEMCHVQLFIEGEYEFNEHGAKWQKCMHELANKNAFDDLW